MQIKTYFKNIPLKKIKEETGKFLRTNKLKVNTSNQFNRACVNFLKHQYTNYDSLYFTLRAQEDLESISLIGKVKRKIYDYIGLIYPSLTKTCIFMSKYEEERIYTC